MREIFKRELEQRESKEMMEIIHKSCINTRNRKRKEEKTKKILNKVAILLIIIFIEGIILLLNNNRKEAMNNCMKNHSKNYCERITG